MPLHNDVFAQQMWAFLCNDIDSCLMVAEEIQTLGSESRFKGALNFPAALMMFSVIDLSAGYYAGREATTQVIADFIAKYFGPHSPELADKKVAKKWYEVFRNGLTHQWSPKAGGVSMDPRPEVFMFQLIGAEEIPVLFVPALFAVLKEALRTYESDLDASPALQKKFKKRYEELVNDDRKEMRILRNMCQPPQRDCPRF